MKTVRQLRAEIQTLELEIARLQKECLHENIFIEDQPDTYPKMYCDQCETVFNKTQTEAWLRFYLSSH